MIQIDMPMPKCCDECFALDEHGDYPYCLISQDQRGYTFNTRDRRMPTCPLKTQEPNNDWISRKRLKNEIQYYIDEAGWGEEINMALGWCLEFIDNQEAVKWDG